MGAIRDMFSKNLRQGGILVAFVAIVAVFAVWTDGKLLDPGNISNLVLQFSYILILAIGMLFVIVVGHIDLSVGSVVALVGAVAATLVIKNGMPWWVGVLAGIATGLVIGAWHGFWVAYVGIPGFIVTLSGMLLFRGMTFRVLNSVSLSPMPAEYQRIASGFLNGLFGGYGFDVFTVVIGAVAAVGYAYSQWRSRSAKIRYEQAVESMGLFIAKLVIVAAVIMYFAWKLSTARGFPIVLIILAFLILAYSFVSKNTIYGRHVYAIGGNVLELDAIAACFIGGAAVTGGVGTVAGAMIGGLVMAVMSNGMQLQGVQVPTQQIVKGLVLLLAVAFDIWNKRRAAAAKS